MEAEHAMELVRQDEELLEWACPDCGRLCRFHLRDTPVRLEVVEKGDQFARHSGANLISVHTGPVGTGKLH